MAVDVAALTADGTKSPPTEFRIFRAGWNGAKHDVDRVLFDEQAAADVMAAFKQWGVRAMVDLEHLSLDKDAPNYDGDARAWCQFEIRDGELWAVNVEWTPDGTERVQNKTQRYVSPVFNYNKKTRRVTSIFNIALTGLPATHFAYDLAASATARDLRKFSTGVSLNDVQAAITAALVDLYPHEGECMVDGPWICDVFDATVVYQYDGKLFEAPYEFNGSSVTLGAPVEVKRSYAPIVAPNAAASQTARFGAVGGNMDPKLIGDAIDAIEAGDSAKALEILKQLVVSAAGGTTDAGGDGAGAGGDGAGAGDGPPPADMVAASAKLRTLTGKPSVGAALEEVEAWRASHLAREAEAAAAANERIVLEASERRRLVGELVKLGAEIPAVGTATGAWADAAGTVPCARLQAEPLADLRARVAALSASKGATPPGPGPVPPAGQNELGLTPEQLSYCAEYKVDPKTYAATLKQFGQ